MLLCFNLGELWVLRKKFWHKKRNMENFNFFVCILKFPGNANEKFMNWALKYPKRLCKYGILSFKDRIRTTSNFM